MGLNISVLNDYSIMRCNHSEIDSSGIGLKNIEKVVKSLNGTISISRMQDLFLAEVNIQIWLCMWFDQAYHGSFSQSYFIP